MAQRGLAAVVAGLVVAGIGGLSLAAVAGAGLASASAADEQVTLTVGLIQDLDTPNVTAGFLVSSYELWNLQYAALTDKAAADFATVPGLAESWEVGDGGLSYTYTLREDLKWSDGEPLTADDVAFTINTSRDQEWINHFSSTANLEATVIDDRTVKITSAVPDPKLPLMDVYILPKHIWEPVAQGDITTYEALDGVGSGPFTLQEWKSGQSWTMVANPNYYKGTPAIDQVVFRVFTNGDAMVAALQQGEIDAAHSVPSSSFESLGDTEGIEAVFGQQGGFTELAMNGMAGGLGDGHPALQDVEVRHAIHRAIDKQALFDRVILGLGTPGVTLSVSPDPAWKPVIPEAEQYTYDPDAANAALDAAGYLDTDGNGIREMPDGSQELTFRYAERSESDIAAPIRELITGFLEEVGIATTVDVFDDTQLTEVIASGEYDLFVWGWTPFTDPDSMLSYFTCAQLTTDVEADRLQRRQLVQPRVRRALHAAELGARSGHARRPRAPDVAAVLRRVDLRGAVRGRRPAGVPDRSVHRLDTAARRDRARDLQQLLADLLPAAADRGRHRRRRRWHGHGRADRPDRWWRRDPRRRCLAAAAGRRRTRTSATDRRCARASSSARSWVR